MTIERAHAQTPPHAGQYFITIKTERSRSSEARKIQDANSTEGTEHVKREEQLESFRGHGALHRVSLQCIGLSNLKSSTLEA